MAPQTLDQSEGEKVCGPDRTCNTKIDDKGIVGLLQKISSQQVSAQVKIEVMQRAVATCPKINMGCGRKVIPSLLDSGSQVTLIRQSFFEQEILPHIKPSDGEKANAHQLFQLTAANNGKLPVSMYVELDLNFLGIVVPKVGVLITQEPNELLESRHKTKLPGVVGWNLIKLAYQVFVKNYGILCLDNFDCPTGVSPLLFSQLCVYHHCKAGGLNSDSVTLNTNGQQQLPKKKAQNSTINKDGLLGKVLVGNATQPICVPGNSALTIPGRLGKNTKVPSGTPCLIDTAAINNLPQGISVNRCLVHPRGKTVPVILMNQNSHNIWIRQPLLAAEICTVEHLPWDYGVDFQHQGNKIEVAFQPLPPADIMATVKSVHDEPGTKPSAEPRPTFGPRPNTSAAEFDFQQEVERLPFKLNLGDVHLEKEHQARFIDLIYSNQEVFSLHDEDLGYCDKLTHTIPTSTDKPVYLPHRTIPRQLQGEVHECLNTWLCQGIIRPSNSPYASQVVLVRKKTGEIRICVDYRKLNSITIRDAFPLPRIDEALQVVHNCNVFTSFDLAQGYLQLAMAEEDIKKTAFRAGSSGLYEFTRMPFGLSNAGSSFCRLMEQCLGDQQFVTLLLYLDDICIFAPDVSAMLDRMELVFNRLKTFNLKIKPKKSYFFQASVIFLGHVLSADGISANPEKVDKVKDWPVPSNAKELHSFLGLASYYRRFIPNFAQIAKCLHQLVGPTNVKKTKGKRKEVTALEETKKPELTIPKFVWASEHQKAFDALKLALTTAPVLGYPDFEREFILETDASLRGLGAVLSQVDDLGKTHVIAYASRTLRPSERSMRNYSSAKLELLALKWAVTEKFRDYLLGSKFTVYTDNNPLAYIQTSKLGASQIHWLSELALFDFNIIYRSGKSNQAADALSRPQNQIVS